MLARFRLARFRLARFRLARFRLARFRPVPFRPIRSRPGPFSRPSRSYLLTWARPREGRRAMPTCYAVLTCYAVQRSPGGPMT